MVEKYDEVLYGLTRQILVNQTHSSTKKWLKFTKCRSFLEHSEVSGDETDDKDDLFIWRVIEAASPIIPIIIRNRSLDGGYLRAVLVFSEATDVVHTV